MNSTHTTTPPTRPPKPKAMPPDTSRIPEELRASPQWLGWRWNCNGKKWDKPPFSAKTGQKCNDGELTSLAGFDDAVAALQRLRLDGLGFRFLPSDPFAGLDLDDCRDPQTGELTETANTIIRWADTYCEVSPSGCGVKLYFRGKLPWGSKADHKVGVEAYDQGRYFCVTGQHLNGTPATLREIGNVELRKILAFAFGVGENGNSYQDARQERDGQRRNGTDDRALALDALGGLSASRAEGYHDWLAVGMALHATDTTLLDSWDSWSQKSAKYQPGVCAAKWRSFGAGSRALGLGSLIHWARQDGWHPPWERNGSRKPAKKKPARRRRSRPLPSDGQPTILVGTDEERVVSEAVAALARRPDVFQRGGVLVHVTREAEPPRGLARPRGAPRIAVLPRAVLRERLAAVASWGCESEEEVKAVHPPSWAVEAVEARGQWPGIRRLEGVVEVPILRADGTVLTSRGYDAQTGILWEPAIDFPPVPPRPAKDDARRALDSLLEVLVDFPLVDDAHRAAWVAAVLTPLARFAFHGPAPLFLVDANVRGAGKTRLVDCVGLIASGREMARMVAPTNSEEARKAITALALAGEPLILFDNVVGTFGSGPLDAALTGTTWSDRLLGASKTVSDIPLFATWYATTNNAALAADTARRCLWIRLESSEESPEERSGFRHADLLAWVRQERGRLAVAALTILRAYHVAGRPSMGLTPWGSFEAWSDLVRQAVVWCRLPDPAATRRDLVSQADRDAAALRLLLDGWEELDPTGRGVTVAEALKAVGQHPDDYPAFSAALGELGSGDPSKGHNARSIGMKLHHLRRRVVGGRFLDSRPSRAGAVWLVGRCGTSGTCGTISSLGGRDGERKEPGRG